MRRREFITLLGGAAGATRVGMARAQHATMPMIGYLAVRSPTADADIMAAFIHGLENSGYIVGKNVTIEHKFVEGRYDHLETLASELIDHHPSVIFAAGLAAAQTVKAATTVIPIIFTSGVDPVQYGLVAELNRPGSNISGVSLFSSTLTAKRLELLRELVDAPFVVGFLVNSNNPNMQTEITAVQEAARSIGIQSSVMQAANELQIEAAYDAIETQRIGGLLISADAFFISRRDQLISLSARHHIPAVYNQKDFPVAGGLVSYGAPPSELYRHAGSYVGRVLSGTKPAELPVLQPTRFELVINLKTARALGIMVPATLLARADEVIE